jgi:hypothetical protein
MTTALARFQELKRRYRELVPRRRISSAAWRDIARAASLEQVREIVAIESALGRSHDSAQLVRLGHEVRAQLTSAGAILEPQRKVM